jgi:hypothetical protein
VLTLRRESARRLTSRGVSTPYLDNSSSNSIIFIGGGLL